MHRAHEPSLDRVVLGNGRSRRQVDVAALERALRSGVRGEVRFDDGGRALYATDASNYRQTPLGVVCPKDAADVAAAVAICRAFDAPVLPRGGGTSLGGQCCNVAVVLDFTRYMYRVLEIDPVRKLARVQPGVALDRLRREAQEHGLTFGPDPATHVSCTLGGMIGNNSCGIRSVLAGRTADNVHSLEILTYRGHRMRVGALDDEAYAELQEEGGPLAGIATELRALAEEHAERIRARYPRIPRRVSGFNLDELLPEQGFHLARSLVGSEGTCALVLEATVRLVDAPRNRLLVVLGFQDVFQAADAVPTVLAHDPIGLEGVDEHLVDDMRRRGMHGDKIEHLPDGEGWLIVELAADTRKLAEEKAQALVDALETAPGATEHVIYTDDHDQEVVWEIRESGLAATARVPGRSDAWPGWEDSAVPPERLGDYLRDLRALFDAFGYTAALYGHFGDGCVHCRIDFDLRSDNGIADYRRFVEAAADLCLAYGGSLSGEHGDGQARGELLGRMYGEDLVDAMRRFKRIWDPDGAMNPGKVVDPYPLDSHLRLGADYEPREPETRFRYPNDDGKLSRATLRCVGVGTCRRESGGTMCPSYKVTREEQHSTRGRAHLLWEMLQPDSAVRDGFASEAVKESLDLCLSCKGCKSDCPMNVDLATYKAEFLHRYHQHHRRPLRAYLLGWIPWWARLGSLAPSLANLLMRAPGLSAISKRLAGVHPERALPTLAPVTFRSWFRSRKRPNAGGDAVLLWADTWTDRFRPEVGIAAVEVLEAAGFDVQVADRSLCCGRPLYEFGMLEAAERLLEEAMEVTRPWVARGVPVVVLEPSCASVFRDELCERYPDREEAKDLREATMTLAEFLVWCAPDMRPQLNRRVLFQGHCHQKAVIGADPDHEVLRECGVELDVLEAGCCGMAGSFGYEREKFDVSVAIAEQGLLPPIREAGPTDIIVADGFSCRSQIEDRTRRRGVHLAQVLQLALRHGPEGEGASIPPEATWDRPFRWRPVVIGALAVGAAAAWWLTRDRE